MYKLTGAREVKCIYWASARPAVGSDVTEGQGFAYVGFFNLVWMGYFLGYGEWHDGKPVGTCACVKMCPFDEGSQVSWAMAEILQQCWSNIIMNSRTRSLKTWRRFCCCI